MSLNGVDLRVRVRNVARRGHRRGPVSGLVRSCHLPPTIVVIAIAGALAAAVGRGWGVVSVVAAVGSGQLAVGWSNDFIDRFRDRAAGRCDKPIVTGEVSGRAVRNAAVVATMACVPLSFLSGWRAGGLHLVAVAIAFAYNVKLKCTVASPIPYAVAFGMVPAFVTLGMAGHPWPPLWAVGAAASLGCGAHFINTLNDIEEDRRLGVNGLPQRIGATRSLAVGASLMIVAVALETFAPSGGTTPVAGVLFGVAMVLVIAVIVAGQRRATRIAWPLTLCVALIATSLLIASGASLR
ncbi:MAG: UbiA family prenyltransferase [Acidimicrobiales bacterium]